MKANPKVLTGLIPIVPDSGLYLVPNGRGADARFAGIFRDVWPCLPPPTRRVAEQYWRAHGRRHFRKGPDHTLEVRPDACRRCGTALAGDDPQPLRHQVLELPVIRPG